MVAAGASRVVVPNAAQCWDLQFGPQDSREQRQQRVEELVESMRATGLQGVALQLQDGLKGSGQYKVVARKCHDQSSM